MFTRHDVSNLKHYEAAVDERIAEARRADAAEAEVRARDTVIEAVRALHRKGVVRVVTFDRNTSHPRETCLHCTGTVEGGFVPPPTDAYIWPCATIRALEGATE